MGSKLCLSEHLSLEDFKKIFPNSKNPELWYDSMNEVFQKTSIDSIERQSAFIAQCGHESGGWRVFSENLNYSAKALNIVFPKYFKNAGVDAQKYHRKPQEIANIVYANRMGNGNTDSNDGWNYRGRGPIQLTGKNNYTEFNKYLTSLGYDLDILDNPNIVSEDGDIGILSAIWYWEKNGLNYYCDTFNIRTLTKRINGGFNGLEDRKHHYIECLISMLGVLKKGSKGEEVKVIQRKLGLTDDGIFGRNTQNSIKIKQSELGISPDGVVGPSTIEHIFS